MNNKIEKIIFLDIDGVLNTSRSKLLNENQKINNIYIEKGIHAAIAEGYLFSFDPLGVNLINKICEETNSKIVISSSWRRLIKHDKLLSHLISQGIKSEYLHEKEPICSFRFSSEKIHDILEWIYSFKEDYPNKELSYLIFDDDRIDYLNTFDNINQYQILIDSNDGINYSNYLSSILFFNNTYKNKDVSKLTEEIKVKYPKNFLSIFNFLCKKEKVISEIERYINFNTHDDILEIISKNQFNL